MNGFVLGTSAKLCLVLSVVSLALLYGCAGRTGHGVSRAAPGPRAPSFGGGSSGGGETVVSESRRMSLRAAVGQMFIVGMRGTTPDRRVEGMIREENIGGVMLFGYNMQSREQTRALTGALQREARVPLFIATDQEGGEVADAPWVSPEPSAEVIGRGGDPGEARKVALKMGRQLRAGGVNTDFSPVVDTGFGAAIGSRSYGEDPALVSKMGAAAVRGFREAGIVSVAKHFPNHGVATSDSHTGLPVVDHDLRTVRAYDLPPFEAAVQAGVPMVMVGHLLYPAIDPERPASLSPKAIGMLRHDLGFRGVIVTDDLNMAGAKGSGTPAEAAVRAAKAGADLLLITSSYGQEEAAYRAVLRAVRSGEIPERQVRASVRRILEVKREYLGYETHAR